MSKSVIITPSNQKLLKGRLKMKLKTITETESLEFILCSVDDFIQILETKKQTALNAGFERVEIEFWQEWDSAEVRLISSRLETEEEYLKRTNKSGLNEFEKFLKRISKYKPGWDGYDGVLPTEEQIASAKIFFDNLPKRLTVKLRISLAGDGEINFNFSGKPGIVSKKGFMLDFGINAENIASYYCKISGSKKLHGDDFDVTTQLPEDILNVISK